MDAVSRPGLVRLHARPHEICVSGGRSVLVAGRDGFVGDDPDGGFFTCETRMLSRYRWLIDGAPFHPVTVSNIAQHAWAGYYIAPAREEPDAFIAVAAQNAIELHLRRLVGEGLHEDVDVTNFSSTRQRFTLSLALAADFADQAETREEHRHEGHTTATWRESELAFDHRAENDYAHQGETGHALLERSVRIRFVHSTTAPKRTKDGVAFEIDLGPRRTWRVCVDVVPAIEGRELPCRYGCSRAPGHEAPYAKRTAIFLSESTRFESRESATLGPAVAGALEQGRRDIAALRLFDLDKGQRSWTPAAGLPAYVALFGRDALTAAWEAAPLGPELMTGTLAELARWQARETNDWRDEQPGRMLHEARTGPLAALNLNPRARYYGSITTSGFYPFVVAQLWHWTADKALVKPFIDPAVAALKWLADHGDRDGDGFFEYQTRSNQGLANQAWKDSGDAIVYPEGRQVAAPIATCEEQGIVYAAKLNLAEVLFWFDRKDEALRLYREAKELKKRFNDAFWMEDEGFFAMALDSDSSPVRSIGSNALHCIATGIADAALVPRALKRLFADDMFSGWGVRTLSSHHPAYNPYSYHRGSVWPVEHGPFAVGAYRYGCHEDVERICRAQFELAAICDHFRLPECIAGHARDATHPFPPLYPLANAPQAWSSTTVYTLLQAMLGLQPFAPFGVLFVDPFLPAWLPEISIKGLRVADARVSLRFFRKANGATDYEVFNHEGRLDVFRQPSPWSLTADFGDRLKDIVASFVR